MEVIRRMTARASLSLGGSRKGGTLRSNSKIRNAEAAQSRQTAPHPIPPGSEGRVCPMIEFLADTEVVNVPAASKAQLDALQADPDIAEEIRTLTAPPVPEQAEARIQVPKPVQFVPLNVVGGSHRSNSSTRQLVQEVGLPKLLRFTESFYQKCFADGHVDKFIASHDEPHHERFALWIQEKFGDGTPWTEERRTRTKKYMNFGNGERVQVAHDRSSAHFAAWHSPKRERHKWGEHFKPDDARVWMRLHFWAARETGMFEHEAFMEYYTRFVGHFISVYSRFAPPFTRESVRWSADPKNIQRYLDAGRTMTDVIGKNVDRALAALPAEERQHNGRGGRGAWPYD